MKYRKLGPSGTIVSSIGLGTMDFGTLTPEEDAFAVLDAFVEAGGNLVDTANVYGRGVSEETIGRWFAARPSDVTDTVVLATKARATTGPGVNEQRAARPYLARQLSGSLRRLGRDSIDLYQLHAWDPLTPPEETLSFLGDAVRAGKIHYIGLSNFTGWQTQLVVSTARAMGVDLPITLQQQYNLLSRENEWEVIPAAEHNGIGFLPWSPLADGFLTGKYKRDSAPASNTRAAADNPIYRWTTSTMADADRTWAIVDAVVDAAGKIGATPAQVALSWLSERPGVVAPIIGARSVAQLRENLTAADLTLDGAVAAGLDSVSSPRAGRYPYGNFGQAQRSRRIDGGMPMTELVTGADASPHPKR